jgi:opacity protein-like surface antigen
MKRAIVVTMVLFLASCAVAQTKTAIMLNSGLNLPSSSEYFSDYWSASYNLGGGVEIYLNPQLSLVGYVDYNRFSFDDEKVSEKLKISDEGITSSGGGINILNLNANIKYHFIENTQKVSPYILGGIGYMSLSVSELTATDEQGHVATISVESIGAFSLTIGLGSEFAVSPTVSIFVDARYVLGFTDGDILSYTSDNIRDLDDKGAYVLQDNTNYIPFRVGICYKLP